MIKVKLRFCMAFQYDVLKITTIGEMCNLVFVINNQRASVSNRWLVIKICGSNNTFLKIYLIPYVIYLF